jgi:hypothetical protein
MIKEIVMYAAVCDSCGKQHIDENRGYCAWTDAISARDVCINNDFGWQEDKDKLYCPDCWYWNDDEGGEEIIFGKKPIKTNTHDSSK